MVLKKCSRCQTKKPATLKHFAAHPKGLLKIGSWCRDCANAYRREKRAIESLPKPTKEERFFAKVDKNGPVHPILKTRCHLWTAACEPKAGYGVFTLDGRKIGAHVMAWILKHGPLRKDRCALHRCDVRPCVNVDHLFSGTRGDNNRDCAVKGRRKKGEAHHNAKVDESLVREMRRMAADGVSILQVATHAGVSWRAAKLIVLRQTWKHVA